MRLRQRQLNWHLNLKRRKRREKSICFRFQPSIANTSLPLRHNFFVFVAMMTLSTFDLVREWTIIVTRKIITKPFQGHKHYYWIQKLILISKLHYTRKLCNIHHYSRFFREKRFNNQIKKVGKWFSLLNIKKKIYIITHFWSEAFSYVMRRIVCNKLKNKYSRKKFYRFIK